MPVTQVRVDYASRVEGEVCLDISFSQGQLKDLSLRVFEPPRFIEALLAGRSYTEAPEITSRICGICPTAHALATLRAVEKALGLEVDERTRQLRKLLAMGGMMQSHVLHVFFLAAPDYLGCQSALELAKDHMPVLKRAFRLKALANRISEEVGGRAVHTVTTRVGHFSAQPNPQRLASLRKELEGAREDALEAVRMVSGFEFPALERHTEYLCLSSPDEYALYEGRLVSSEGLDIGEDEYRSHVLERQAHATSVKYSTMKGGGSVMVGPLARFNLNFDKLSREAQSLAREYDFKPLQRNTFKATLARAIELVHLCEESIRVIDSLEGLEDVGPREGRRGPGLALTEAPRGLLYHSYLLNARGLIEKADIVTPTAHNALNMEEDLRSLAPMIASLPEREATLRCEMLLRAYDPCISCSVHSVKVRVHR